jgi:TPR repeat protein
MKYIASLIFSAGILHSTFVYSASDQTKKFLSSGGVSLTPTAGVKGARPTDPEAIRVYNEILAKAQAGEAESQQIIGTYFLSGKSPVTKDEKLAESWFLKAADQGWVRAFSSLEYLHGDKVRSAASPLAASQELTEACKWAVLAKGGPVAIVAGKKLSEQTKAEGEALAKQYQAQHGFATIPEAVGVPRSSSGRSSLDDKMLKYNEIKAKADAGDAEAQYRMAGYSVSPPSNSVPRNSEAELAWLLKSAKQNYLPAIHRLASYYSILSSRDRNNADLMAESLKWRIISGKMDGNKFRHSEDSSISEATQAEAQRRADAYFAERNGK